MKKFDIPFQYESWYIKQIKEIRHKADKLRKNLSPSLLHFEKADFYLARNFGFCYGVQNAVEIVYQTLEENPNKNIYLISEIIHNPEVNNDLIRKGIRFIQDTKGNQLVEWNQINSDDIVITPAFGTTAEIQSILSNKDIELRRYDTTCPFVEKVWNTAEKLAKEGYTIIIHGDFHHEETRATFSRASLHGPVVVVSDIKNAEILGDFASGRAYDDRDWNVFFKPFSSPGFNFRTDFERIAVVNQTTMLASETQAISDYFKDILITRFGSEEIDQRFGSTRDTLCYATNDNQSATIELASCDLDLAIVIGGENSSNTKHLVEIMEKKCPTYFIATEEDLTDGKNIVHFDIKSQSKRNIYGFIPSKDKVKIGITSGASCPDAIFEKVFLKLLSFVENAPNVDGAINELDKRINGL